MTERDLRRTNKTKGYALVFAMPALLFCVSLAGLFVALLIEGPADIAASLAAGCSLIVVIWHFLRRR